MLTMRRTVDDGVMMCAGLAAPSRIPPTVMPPPATTRNALYVMLAASAFGMISRFASVSRREPGNSAVADRLGQGGVRVHFAVDRKPRRRRENDRERIAHLLSGWLVRAAEARMRQQRHARLQAESLHLLGREQGHLGDLVCRRIAVDVRVADEELPPGQDQHLHRGKGLDALSRPDHVATNFK